MKAQVYKKTSQQSIKEGNSRLIFNTLVDYQPISRAGIKKITKLSATTVSVLVEELIANGLVEERGLTDTTEVGRKGILLAVRNQGAYFLGVAISRSHVKCDLYDLSFKLVKSVRPKFHSSEEMCTLLTDFVKEANKETEGRLYGISIGVPAMVDDEEQRIISSTVLDIFPPEDMIERVKKIVPDSCVFMYNNSGFIAYSAKESHKDVSTLFSVDIGEGVGAGLVIDGELFTGSNGFAGEFGHISVDYNGKPCRCGGRGCLEGLVNVPNIIEQIEKVTGKSELTVDGVVNLLDSGNKASITVLDEVAKILAYGLNGIINLFDPELIVISGDIKFFGDHLLVPLKAQLAKMNLFSHDLTIEMSSVEGSAVTLGGAYYSFKNYFGKYEN